MASAEDPLAPNTLRDLLGYKGGYGKYGERNPKEHPYEPNGVFCPRCKEQRKVGVARLYPLEVATDEDECSSPRVYGKLIISVKCLQCDTEAIGILKESEDELRLYWPLVSSLATPRTPEAVAYYLDQATRCESVGANSAAVVMYRSALELLLHEQKIGQGMLGNRLRELNDDVEARRAPKWAQDLNRAYLNVINKLGNGAIHANDGDISKQKILDGDVLGELQYAFSQILELVYERPARDEANLAALLAASSTFKK